MVSVYQNLGGTIKMPEFRERKLYMHKMQMSDIKIPKEFSDYEKIIEDILCKISDRNNVCYITIDEKHINRETHRRSGIHVDFNWYENLNGHSQHGGKIITSDSSRDTIGNGCEQSKFNTGGMLLVSNFEGCKVWKGEFDGEILDGGDCSKINVEKLQNEIMPSGDVYFLNSIGIHESIFIDKEVNRSLIRVNFHPEYKFKCR